MVNAVEAGLTATEKGPVVAHVALLIGLAGAVALVGALLGSIAGLLREAQVEVVTNPDYSRTFKILAENKKGNP